MERFSKDESNEDRYPPSAIDPAQGNLPPGDRSLMAPSRSQSVQSAVRFLEVEKFAAMGLEISVSDFYTKRDP